MSWTQSYVKIRWLAASSRCHLQKLFEPTTPRGRSSSPRFGGPGIAVRSSAGGEGQDAERNAPEAGEGDGFVQSLGGGDGARAGGDAQLEGVAAANPVVLGNPRRVGRWEPQAVRGRV